MENITENTGAMTGEETEITADAAQEVKGSTEEFDELIKGKFKEEFSKKVQGIIDARFRRDKAEERKLKQQSEARAVYDGLSREAEELKKLYPGFDLKGELSNPRFRAMMASPEIDMRSAYEICHRDEIFSSAMASAARVAREKTVQGILATGTRPNETEAADGSSLGTDVKSLSKKQRAQYARRAALGERVTFK